MNTLNESKLFWREQLNFAKSENECKIIENRLKKINSVISNEFNGICLENQNQLKTELIFEDLEKRRSRLNTLYAERDRLREYVEIFKFDDAREDYEKVEAEITHLHAEIVATEIANLQAEIMKPAKNTNLENNVKKEKEAKIKLWKKIFGQDLELEQWVLIRRIIFMIDNKKIRRINGGKSNIDDLFLAVSNGFLNERIIMNDDKPEYYYSININRE